MERINIYCDYHKFGVHQLKGEITIEKNDFHLGDMYDLKGCRKEDIEKVKDAIETLRIMSKHYVSGNHELDLDLNNVFHIYKGIMFTHGDYFHYGQDLFIKWRAQKSGRSKLVRFFLKIIYWIRNKFIDVEISNKILEEAVKFAKFKKCTTVVMGHKHPLKTKVRIKDGITVILLPRGKHSFKIYDGEIYPP